MFGVMSNNKGNFVVIDDKIIYQNGGWDNFREMTDDMDFNYWRIEKVYKDCTSFNMLNSNVNGRSTTATLVYDRERDTKPQYNGKVVCVEVGINADQYTKGKIYQFNDGILINDNGTQIPPNFLNSPINSFEDWQKYSSSEWIEIVE